MASWISCKGCGCVVSDVAVHALVCPMTPPLDPAPEPDAVPHPAEEE